MTNEAYRRFTAAGGVSASEVEECEESVGGDRVGLVKEWG